jgi:NDP-sugar pyrophosphorylase family protein
MRSDILNYNAPIIFENGYYIYSNNDYSIFGRPIKELDLLKDIQSVLVENFDTINNENIQHLILELARITKIKVPKKCAPEGYGIYEKRAPGSTIEVNLFEEKLRYYLSEKDSKTTKIKYYSFPISIFKKPRLIVDEELKKELFNWNFIFESFESVKIRSYKCT